MPIPLEDIEFTYIFDKLKEFGDEIKKLRRRIEKLENNSASVQQIADAYDFETYKRTQDKWDDLKKGG